MFETIMVKQTKHGLPKKWKINITLASKITTQNTI